MSLLFTIDHLKTLIHEIGIQSFFQQLIERMRGDYERWNEFDKSARIASHYPHGVIELMPISDDSYYAFKYVNGHPNNPQQNCLTVAAVGMLADVKTGYPLLISEMTVLTAIRTAAASALASQYLANPEQKNFGMIGTGAQAEFQVIAHLVALGISHVYYYDPDSAAVAKFIENLKPFPLALHACDSAQQVIEACHVVTTATANKCNAKIITQEMLKPGMHINGIGGDCPGKTELDVNALHRCKIVVQYLEQTLREGETQHLTAEEVYAELWELVTQQKKGRQSESEITLFDSVGFALEDYSVLRLVYDLALTYKLGERPYLIPSLDNPKNLYSVIA